MNISSILIKQQYGFLSLLLALVLFSPELKAQEAQAGWYTYEDASNNHYYEFVVPTVNPPAALHLTATGADGGKRTFGTRVQNGGRGAETVGYVTIGDGSGEIPAGSTLRFIPGQKGGTDTFCGGGGGGSAIAFKKQGSTHWTLLMVAGGGGGAGRYYDGREGTNFTSGSNGIGSNGYKQSNAGQDGYGGKGSSDAGNGGGALGDGLLEDGAGLDDQGRKGFSDDNIPNGGQGGSRTYAKGGFGFGGGGAGAKNDWGDASGGGGGGYSGGGGGDHRGGGGGGGSYANTEYLVLYKFNVNGSTSSHEHGKATYQYINSISDKYQLQLSFKPSKCLTVANDELQDGDNMILKDCDNNHQTQTWEIDENEIKPYSGIDLCVNVDGGSTQNGANIRIRKCNNTKAQKWIYDGKTKKIRSFVDLDKCLYHAQPWGDIANKANIELWGCNASGGDFGSQWDRLNAEVIRDPSEVQYIVPASNTNLALQAAGGPKWGSNIQLGSKSNSDNTIRWVFNDQQIQFGASKDLTLSLADDNTSNGKSAQLRGSASNSTARQWIYNGATKQIHSVANPAKCLEVKDGNFTKGANIQIADCENVMRQKFFVQKK